MSLTVNDKYLINRDTYNRISSTYSLKNYSKQNMQPRLEDFLSYLSPNSKILDLGCGPGHDTKYLASKGHRVIGVDYSDKMIGIAHRKTPEAKFECANILDYEIESQAFEGIWCNSVLLHFIDADKQKVLRNIFNGLKPGGILHVSFSSGNGERYLERVTDDGLDQKFYYDVTPEYAITLLTESGFEVISYTSEVYSITFLVYLVRRPVV